jgi:hypothetical protein
VDAAGLKKRKLAAAREKLDIRSGDVSNNVKSIIHNSNTRQALIVHNLQSIG